LAWFGLAWFGLAWFGLVWFGLVLYTCSPYADQAGFVVPMLMHQLPKGQDYKRETASIFKQIEYYLSSKVHEVKMHMHDLKLKIVL
jgi:hypothetical protein